MRWAGGKSKFHNTPTRVDGLWFASKAEARRYIELKLLQKAGQISKLMRQEPFPIMVNGILVTTYVADFTYIDHKVIRRVIVEDVKGYRTKEYVIKKKLMKAVYGIDIVEISARKGKR